jgi:hypothetical protein
MQLSADKPTPLVAAAWAGKAQLQELRVTLDRAMNTWEPQDWPVWLGPLSDRVDKELAA